MPFTDIFIRRPVLAIVVSALILTLGIQAVSQLQIREYPEVEDSQIYVRTYYPGASARTVQGFVTTPLQERIASANGVEYITSRSDPGTSEITVHVRLGESSSEVLSEVISKANEARSILPPEVEDPVIGTSLGGDGTLYIAFFSEQMSIPQVNDYLQREIQPELATIEGVGQAEITSDRYLAMRIWLDPAKMAALGVTATDVNAALRSDNYVSAAGTTRGALVRASVDAQTDMQSPQEFADIVVRQEGDSRVTIGDVADVELANNDY
ncbi:MAG: efflux RND transporter permease subunit, partial [Pseudomonadota bacterium]